MAKRGHKTTLYMESDNYELTARTMVCLRKQFLCMPFEEFVNAEKLRSSLATEPEILKYLNSCLSTYLDFGLDSYRYFMYLEDAKSVCVAEADADHDIHTDMEGRSKNWKVKDALGFAMGFTYFSEELKVEELGLDADPGYVEETVYTERGMVQIFGQKNTKGNFHGYCVILQDGGITQQCFLNDGVILAGRMVFANGMCEDIKSTGNFVADPFVARTAYALRQAEGREYDHVVAFDDKETRVKKIPVDRALAEKMYDYLGNYVLRAEYCHYVEYPYDEGAWETEKSERTPTPDMALLEDGVLIGAVFKTNGSAIIPLDCERRARWNWKMLAVRFEQKSIIGPYTVSLRKKEEKGETDNEA